MTAEQIYEWDVAQEGDESPPFVFAVTPASIAAYCTAVRLDNPVYLDDQAARGAGFPGIVAPPTMCYTYAPMRRVDLIARRGYVAPEQAEHGARSTPFVATEIVFLGRPVRPGDVVTSTTTLRAKWERKGNKFLTFAIEGTNQRRERVAEYTYTCIWEYAKGRKVGEPSARPPGAEVQARPRTVTAATAAFDAVEVGDGLPVVVKAETQETIDRFRALAISGEQVNWKDLHTDPGFAEQGIFGGTVNMGVATVAYVAEVLERAFPLGAVLASGARLAMQAREPFRAGDTVAFTGTVIGKRDAAGGRFLDVEVQGTNSGGRTIAKATATVVL